MSNTAIQQPLIELVRALPLPERVSLCLQGNQNAIGLFNAWCDVIGVWEELTTPSGAALPDDIDGAMFAALVEIPANPFFRRHADSLLPVLVNAVANARGAAKLAELGDRSSLAMAYAVRADYANLLVQLASLVGGPGWACQVAPLVRACWTDETFDEFEAKANAQRQVAAKAGD